jgi:hypothetical protein
MLGIQVNKARSPATIETKKLHKADFSLKRAGELRINILRRRYTKQIDDEATESQT